MKQKNNIIFLDIDGVLNYTKWYQGLIHYKYLDEEDIDPICIERVKIICEICNAKIVISSDWRLDWDITLKRLSKFGLNDNFIIDKTPFLNFLEVKNINRGKEIDEWLKNNKCDNYLILDDMRGVMQNFTEEQIKHLVWIDSFYGLTNKHVKQSLKIFNIL